MTLPQLPLIQEIEFRPPQHILLQLANETYLCFLDSAKHHPQQGQFSFIGFDPFLTIKSKNNKTLIKQHTNQHTQNGNPFDILNTQLAKYVNPTHPDLPWLPFQGGAMGYFAYNLLHHLETIQFAEKDIIAAPDMYIGFYDCIIAFEHNQQRAWIISQGFPEIESSSRLQRAIKRAEWTRHKINLKSPNPSTYTQSSHIQSHCHLSNRPLSSIREPKSIRITSNFSRADYCRAIKKTLDYIYAGDIFQANITQCFSSKLPPNIQPIDLYIQLRHQNPAPFSAFINFDSVCVASSSPERFLSLCNGKVETRPIKGTQPRGDTPTQDEQNAQILLNSQKDKAENIMIVDLMRNDLSRVCVDHSVVVPQCCQLESYETVHHLVSVVKGQLAPNKNAIDLLKATFPAGSITGAPKVRAMEIIHDIEPSSRGIYCGNIGYIGFNGNMDTSVVIRTYIIKDNQVFFQAGGGIVADSDPASEYEESIVKAKALQKILLTYN